MHRTSACVAAVKSLVGRTAAVNAARSNWRKSPQPPDRLASLVDKRHRGREQTLQIDALTCPHE